MDTQITRRNFIGAAAGAAAMAIGGAPAMAAAGKDRFKIIAFSKPFQTLNFEQTADYVAEVGWDGIECPVRAKGQVEPARVEEDLPKFVEIMKKRGKEIVTMTTDVKEVTPLNEKVLRTAAKLGIKKYRLGVWRYVKNKSIPDQLAEIQPKLRELAALNKDIGIQAGFQNHSGADYVGSPLWDIYILIKDLDPQYMSVHFDIGHATIEGGLSWPVQARLMQPFYGAVYVKDFVWDATPTGGKMRWMPLGQGFVRKSFIDDLKKSAYTGPISQHHEYFKSDDPKENLAAYRKDLETLKQWLA